MAKRERENPDYAAAVGRMIRAHGRRVVDPADLPDLVQLHDVVAVAIAEAVQSQREIGFSWAEIAQGLGTTKQAAQQRFSVRPVTESA